MTNDELEKMARQNAENAPPVETPTLEREPITADAATSDEPVSQLSADEDGASVLSALNSRSILLAVSTSKMGIRRKVKASRASIDGAQVGDEIAEHAVTVSKKLLKCDEYDAICKADNAFYTLMMSRVIHSQYRKGTYLLPTRLFEWFVSEINEYIEKRARLIDAFIEVYEARVEEARQDLGPLFESSDYPSVRAARESFSVRWQAMAREAVDERLKEFSPTEYERQASMLRKSQEEACEEVRRTLRLGLLNLLENLITRLEPDVDGKAKILRSSTVENLNQWLSLFEDRDITNDRQLMDTVATLKNVMAGTDRDVLASSDAVREQTLAVTSIVAEQVGQMVGKKPRRKMRFGSNS